ncbi:MAG TPA: AAA family ATPase, partial [Candidatus Cloacimonas sp.]|nr:AAA family ATPase [Candidatus Cloacimonas sp.]
MLKQVTIKGFKGITDLTLNLDKINVLIGINSSGKTTILQALDLLANCVSRDVSEYLKDKNWKVSDIKS